MKNPKVGDVVTLPSGTRRNTSVEMTIEEILYKDSSKVRCVWFDIRNRLCRKEFVTAILDKLR